MAFSDKARLNLFTKALAAGVIDANSVSAWYETFFPFQFQLDATKVLMQLDLLKANPAGTMAQARVLCGFGGALNGVVQDLSQHIDAIRLSPVVGTNQTTWAAYEVYGDPTSKLLDNWMLPALVPQASGAPSNGFSILLWNGDPNNGGVIVSTTEGSSGVGENRADGWIWNYANGLLFLATDFVASVSDPYITGFRYVGTTVADLKPEGFDDLLSQLNINSNLLALLQQAIEDNRDRIVTLEDLMNDVLAQVGDISEAQLQANADGVSANQDAIGALQDDVGALNTTVQDQAQQIQDLQSKVDGDDSDIKIKFVK